MENGGFLVSQRGRKPIILVASADNRWLAGLPEAVSNSYAISQVVLAFQLPFAIVPLAMFTHEEAKMGALVASGWLTLVAGVVAAIIIALNMKLLWDIAGE